MKTEYGTDTAFLYPITGRAGTPLFYTLMLGKEYPFPQICPSAA